MSRFASVLNRKTLSVVAACLVAFIVVFLWYPSELFSMPMQNFDTPAHLYAVEKLLSDGVAEVFHLSPSGGFYPPLFHMIAASFAQFFGLFSGVSAAWIFGAGVVFPIGMYFLAKETLTSVKSRCKKFVLLVVPVLSVSFMAFPYSLLDVGTLYAYGLGVSLLPWLLYFTKKFWRVLSNMESKKALIVPIVGILASLFLVLLAQPRVLFLAIPIVLIDAVYFVIKQWKVKKKLALGTLTIGGGAMAIFIAGIGFYVFKSLRPDLLLHPENWFEGVVPTHSWFEAILAWLTGSPSLFGEEFISIMIIVIIIATLIFSIFKWRNEITQKFMILYSLFGVIYVFCVSSNSGFAKIISAPWYQNGWRILAVIPIIVIPVSVFAMVKLCDWLANRNKLLPSFLIPALIVVCVVTVLFGTASLKLRSQVVSQAMISETTLFSQNELEISQNLDLESNSLILADPTTGANFISFFSDYQVIFPVINPDTARQDDLRLIMEAFDKADGAKLNETVCSYDKKIYFFDFGQQSDIFGGEHMLKPWYGFHSQTVVENFVTSDVMKKISSDGDYAIYQFTCE